MSEITRPSASDLLRLAAEIVSAHVANNAVAPDALPALIRSVHTALAGVDQPVAAMPDRPQPAVPIKRSVFRDYLVCLEDGAKVKMLKRYLKVRFDLTPEGYRERWGLPRDYPMVAPSYAARRSTIEGARPRSQAQVRRRARAGPASAEEARPPGEGAARGTAGRTSGGDRRGVTSWSAALAAPPISRQNANHHISIGDLQFGQNRVLWKLVEPGSPSFELTELAGERTRCAGGVPSFWRGSASGAAARLSAIG